MKNFFQFLSETQSQASMQANKLNLKSDGHGGWLDSRGKFVAKTEDGKLKFVSKKEAKAEEDKAKRGPAKPEAASKPKAAAKPEEQPAPNASAFAVYSGTSKDTATCDCAAKL